MLGYPVEQRITPLESIGQIINFKYREILHMRQYEVTQINNSTSRCFENPNLYIFSAFSDT